MSTTKRRLQQFGMLFLASLTLLAGCAQARMESDQLMSGAAPAAPELAMEMEENIRAGNSFENSVPADTQRLVIKNADLSIVVSDPPAVMEMISQLADELAGYVVSANLHQSQLESGVKVPRGSITIRVPAEHLDEALARIEAESDRLPLSKNINSQDVTSDYTDLASRLSNLESAEAQLKEIMASAFETEDVLHVYDELIRVREQIEVIKGQMQYYEQSAALSAISVELIANEAVQPLTIGGWQPVGVAKDAIQALINALKFLATAAIWVILFLAPVLAVFYVIFVLPLSFVWRFWRKRRGQRKVDTGSSPTNAKE